MIRFRWRRRKVQPSEPIIEEFHFSRRNLEFHTAQWCEEDSLATVRRNLWVNGVEINGRVLHYVWTDPCEDTPAPDDTLTLSITVEAPRA